LIIQVAGTKTRQRLTQDGQRNIEDTIVRLRQQHQRSSDDRQEVITENEVTVDKRAENAYEHATIEPELNLVSDMAITDSIQHSDQ
jgi:hypothetical protein